jgi:hypothetical protein
MAIEQETDSKTEPANNRIHTATPGRWQNRTAGVSPRRQKTGLTGAAVGEKKTRSSKERTGGHKIKSEKGQLQRAWTRSTLGKSASMNSTKILRSVNTRI